jgi:hypothetical protein
MIVTMWCIIQPIYEIQIEHINYADSEIYLI